MVEVEVKIPIDSAGQMKEKLQALSFVCKGEVLEEDFYYSHPSHDFRASDEALRIRTRESLADGSRESFITYKGKKLDTVTMARREKETKVEDGKVLADILEAADFIPVLPVRKKRAYYFKDSVTICIDEVEGLGSFMEAEIMAETEAERPEAVERLSALLMSLGYSMEDTIRTSYLGMLEQKEEIC